MDDAYARVAELAGLLEVELGADLLGLYLFGSLTAGGYVDGRSDIDLLAVLERDVDEERLPALERLHAGFGARHPEWIERVEVGYVGQSVLQTLADTPAGTIAVISPGEPLHIKDVEWDWTLNWSVACTKGEVIRGPPALVLGPAVSVGGIPPRRAGAAPRLARTRPLAGPGVRSRGAGLCRRHGLSSAVRARDG